MSENNVPVYFEWSSYKPDQREYRQNSLTLYPYIGKAKTSEGDEYHLDVVIQVDVPVKHEFLANSEDILTAQLAGDPAPLPVLTIGGMKYVQDQFDAIFGTVVVTPEVKPEVEEDWGSTEEWTAPTTKASNDDSAWDEAESKSDETAWEEDWK